MRSCNKLKVRGGWIKKSTVRFLLMAAANGAPPLIFLHVPNSAGPTLNRQQSRAEYQRRQNLKLPMRVRQLKELVEL